VPKSLFRALLLALSVITAATAASAKPPGGGGTTPTLKVGDVAIIAVEMTATSRRLAFVPLVDIPAGVTVSFTDQGWLAAGGFRADAATESVVVYTAPAGGLARGTITDVPLPTLNQGSQGDQVIAFQGSGTSTRCVHAVTVSGATAGWNTNATSESTSAMPAGLSSLTAIPLAYGTRAVCVKLHRGMTMTQGEYLALIGNPQTWQVSPFATWPSGVLGVHYPLSLALSATSLPETRGKGTGTLTRTTTGALTVALSTSSPRVVVPASVTFKGTALTASFTYTMVDDAFYQGTGIVEIYGTATGYQQAGQGLTVVDNETLTMSLSLSPSTFTELSTSVAATLKTNFKATTPTFFTADTSHFGDARVPYFVELPAGQQDVTFPVTPIADGYVDGDQTVTFTVSTYADINGKITTATATALVEDADEYTSLTVSVDPSSLTEGETATGTVTRAIGSAGVTVVSLTSSDPAVTVTSPISIGNGQTSATFTVVAVDDSSFTGARDATITAIAGVLSGETTVEVAEDDAPPAAPMTISIPPTVTEPTGYGYAMLEGTITFASAIDTDRIVGINDFTQFVGPSSATIPAGELSGTFQIYIGNDGLADDRTISLYAKWTEGSTTATTEFTIVNVDERTMTANLNSAGINEASGSFELVLRRNFDIGQAAVVRVNTGNPARVGKGDADFAADSEMAIVTLPVFDDVTPNADAVVVLSGDLFSLPVTVLDDDAEIVLKLQDGANAPTSSLEVVEPAGTGWKFVKAIVTRRDRRTGALITGSWINSGMMFSSEWHNGSRVQLGTEDGGGAYGGWIRFEFRSGSATAVDPASGAPLNIGIRNGFPQVSPDEEVVVTAKSGAHTSVPASLRVIENDTVLVLTVSKTRLSEVDPANNSFTLTLSTIGVPPTLPFNVTLSSTGNAFFGTGADFNLPATFPYDPAASYLIEVINDGVTEEQTPRPGSPSNGEYIQLIGTPSSGVLPGQQQLQVFDGPLPTNG